MTATDDGHIAGALLGMAYAVTRRDARDWLNVALLHGLPLQKGAELLDAWDADNAPQVIGSPKCLCTHSQAQHGLDRRGRNVCHGSVVCGCISFRTGGTSK